jgi:hypothetical protein
MKLRLFILANILLLVSLSNVYSNIRINEIVSINKSSLLDEEHNNSDWIELKNTSDKEINLKGWRISDRNNFNSAYILPDTSIKSNEYMCIFASGRDRVVENSYLVKAGGNGISDYKKETKGTFLYKKLSGDFDISYRINSISEVHRDATSGIMLKPELTPESKYFYVYGCSEAKHHYSYTLTRKSNTDINDKENFKRYFFQMNEEFPDYRLRLKREGDSLRVYIFVSGYKWKYKYSEYYPLGESVYAGIAFSSCTDSLGKFVVSDIKINNQPQTPKDFKKIDLYEGEESKVYSPKFIHTDFKLSSGKETVYIWENSGEFIDSLSFPHLKTDVSFGKDEEGNLKFYSTPTPEIKNYNPSLAIAEKPELSVNKSWFDNPINVSINNQIGDIYYTLNGEEPDKSSTKYTGNIHIGKTSVLRVIQYLEGMVESEISTKTFFIDEPQQNLNIVALTVDSLDLWDKHNRGLLVESNLFDKLLEKRCNIEYWDKNDKSLLYQTPATIQIMGVYGARLQEQKPFKIFSKKELGISKFEFPFFGDKGKEEYNKFSIRNAGQDFPYAMMRDVLGARIGERLGLFGSKATPVVMYLNGEYWGKYFLRERIDEDLIANYYDIEENSINVLNGTYLIKNGSWENYDAILDKIVKSENIDNMPEFEKLTKDIDIDNLINYIILEAYIVNKDWFVNNILAWQSDEYDNKYRWLPWDFDAGFGYKNQGDFHEFLYGFHNEPNQKISLLMNKLWQNKVFKDAFINRTCDLMNTQLQTYKMLSLVDSIANSFAPEVARHQSRWEDTAENWKAEVDYIKDFLKMKQTKVYSHWNDFFKLNGTVQLNITSNVDAPMYKINTVVAKSDKINFKYFKNIPIEITALETKENKFIRWEGAVNSQNKKITLPMQSSTALKAIYKSSKSNENIVINEIMYKSAKDNNCSDWIELHNISDKEVDISGWTIKDDKDEHKYIIPENTTIAGQNYLVFCKSVSDFHKEYPKVDNIIGNLDFGFGSSDQVRLYDSYQILIDSVGYKSKAPWYPLCDGTGPSLELINPKTMNTIVWNWKPSSVDKGTPGKKNSSFSSVKEVYEYNVVDIKVIPNVIDNQARIEFTIPEIARYNCDIINLNGERVKDLFVNKNLNPGDFEVHFSVNNIARGIYYVRMVNIKTGASYLESIIVR